MSYTDHITHYNYDNMIFERPHSLVGPKPGMGIYLRVFIPELWLFYVLMYPLGISSSCTRNTSLIELTMGISRFV